MRHTYQASVAAAVFLIFSGYALAAEVPTTFEGFDADGNGYLSSDEVRADMLLSEHFKLSDTNGDGKLDSSEFSAFEGTGRFVPPEDSEVAEPGAAPY